MNSIEQRFYERYVDKHDELRGRADEQTLEVVDYLYKGGKDGEVSDFVEALDEVNKIRLLRKTCKGHIWRAVDSAATIMRNDESSDIPEDVDYKSAVQNFYTADRFEGDLEETRDIQDTQDIMLSAAGKYEGSTTEPSEDELKFRNWLRQNMQHNKRFRNILELFGAFYERANEMKRTAYKKRSQPTGVTQGRDMPNVLTSQKVLMASEEAEILFNLKFAKSALMQTKRHGPVESDRGPIVFLLDTSGSMDNKVGKYRKIDIAIGFMMAMAKMMHDDDRPFKILGFDWSTRLLAESGQKLTEVYRTLLGISEDGGTNIEGAILTGLREADDNTDVLIVTDAADDKVNATTIQQAKGGRKVSCLLVSEYGEDSVVLREAVDSFILARSTDDFEHLIKKAI